MLWVFYGVFVAVVLVVGYFADRYARRNNRGIYANRGRSATEAAPLPPRHANTGEIPVVTHQPAAGFFAFNTAENPIVEDAHVTREIPLPARPVDDLPVVPNVFPTPSVADNETVYPTQFRPPLPPPVRTDTVNMQAINMNDWR